MRERSKNAHGLNGPLSKQCDAARELLTKADRDEVRARYRVGVIVREVRDDEDATFGDRAVERMAEALLVDKATLHRYARVADLWPEREVAEAQDCDGRPLSWTHWVELCRAPAPRESWLARALANGWSTRQLAQEIDAGGEPRSGDGIVTKDTTRAALLETVKSVKSFSAAITGSFEAVLERVERGDAEVAEDVLAAALASFQDVHRKTGEAIARLRVASAPRSGPRLVDTARAGSLRVGEGGRGS